MARPGGGRVAKLLTAIAVVLIVAVFFEGRIRPVVESMIEYQTKVFAFQTINNAMLAELDSAVDYADMVKLTRGGDGMVTSIQTDVLTMNRLKARTADAVARCVEDKTNQSLRVPLGTLFGEQLFSGRGPEVEIKVIPAGYVQSELYNEFASAGINQTLHRIMLKTTVQMVAVLPGFNVKTETTTSFCIAETVIVGAIPDGFTLINGDERSAISKVNDYAAGTE